MERVSHFSPTVLSKLQSAGCTRNRTEEHEGVVGTSERLQRRRGYKCMDNREGHGEPVGKEEAILWLIVPTRLS